MSTSATEGRAVTPAQTDTSTAKRHRRFIYPMRSGEDMAWAELVFGALVLLGWGTCFVMGLMVPAFVLMNRLWNGEISGFLPIVGYSLLILVSYALTNPLLLMCTSTILGSMAQRWQVSDSLANVPKTAKYTAARRFYFDAILRGFFVYLLFIAGYILITDIRFDNPSAFTFGSYLRIAGATSVLGFVVGYDPNLIVRFIQRVIETLPGVEAGGHDAELGDIPTTEEEMEKKEQASRKPR